MWSMNKMINKRFRNRIVGKKTRQSWYVSFFLEPEG